MRRFAIAALALCFVVVVLGAYVRLTAAGLGCPDWPGCYGHVTPTGAEQNLAAQAAYPNNPLHVGKAWREMIHRYAASTLGLLIVIITALAITSRRQKVVGIPFAVLLLITVVVQGALGMLTVTWQLKPLIVTLHLLFGLTTLSLLWWLVLSIRSGSRDSIRFGSGRTPGVYSARESPARTAALVALVALGVQIALGGWTSSNYAAVACPDFPKCQQQWLPETDYRDAFVLWRGLGVNYEGGVLQHPARVAIHFTHRLGALVASAALIFAAVAALRRRGGRGSARVAASAVLGALALQLFIGASMVLSGFPLALATAHNAGAALLALATIALYQSVRQS
ncbi:MAG TPA: COX15/CtaA family protein [Steroidobacteraceae bacterium]|jgi:cytochrome c oxidase assembly protein subunit 15